MHALLLISALVTQPYAAEWVANEAQVSAALNSTQRNSLTAALGVDVEWLEVAGLVSLKIHHEKGPDKSKCKMRGKYKPTAVALTDAEYLAGRLDGTVKKGSVSTTSREATAEIPCSELPNVSQIVDMMLATGNLQAHYGVEFVRVQPEETWTDQNGVDHGQGIYVQGLPYVSGTAAEFAAADNAEPREIRGQLFRAGE